MTELSSIASSSSIGAPGRPGVGRRRSRLPGLPLPSAVVVLAVLASVAAQAQEAVPAWMSKLSIHGYLTQAYAVAQDHPILGIPEDGTTDYRTAALQFRYAMTGEDTVVVQLSHEAFGESPVGEVKDSIELDWAFYEHRFSDATAIKIGKVQIPLGIYNEIRDVGTLIPFYRPPFNFYGEGAFTSETVDGFVASHAFRLGSPWETEAHLYYGGWDLLEIDPGSQMVFEGRVEDQLGVQAWVETPVPGLRVGAGGSRFTLVDQLLTLGEESDLESWHVSIDGNLERLLVRAELLHVDLPPGHYDAYYVQAGLKLSSRWAAYAQADFADLRFAVPPLAIFDERFAEDYGVAIVYSWSSQLMAKVEAHWTEGYRVDEAIDLLIDDPREARYYIASLSVTF